MSAIDWDAIWEHYRDAGVRILDNDEDTGPDLPAAAGMLEHLDRCAVAVAVNGELRFPPSFSDTEVAVVNAWWRRVWPYARELLAFEREMTQELKRLAHA